ncbi:MAG: DUF1311 domain-containing protein [Deltaproteobacteria bacterium]|nr:MAG: DUF1311 domain-containing protein [Deltaproteobacteria bacterium]
MRRSFLLALSALSLTLAGAASAAPPPEPPSSPGPAATPAPAPLPAPVDEIDACLSKADTQAAMNDCAKRAADKADARLREAAKGLRAVLDDAGKERLDRAVKAFVPWRTAACEVDGDVVRGGSMEPLVIGMCHADLTNFWAEGLEQQLKDRQSH